MSEHSALAVAAVGECPPSMAGLHSWHKGRCAACGMPQQSAGDFDQAEQALRDLCSAAREMLRRSVEQGITSRGAAQLTTNSLDAFERQFWPAMRRLRAAAGEQGAVYKKAPGALERITELAHAELIGAYDGNRAKAGQFDRDVATLRQALGIKRRAPAEVKA